jgi:exonuclease VII large subunit
VARRGWRVAAEVLETAKADADVALAMQKADLAEKFAKDLADQNARQEGVAATTLTEHLSRQKSQQEAMATDQMTELVDAAKSALKDREAELKEEAVNALVVQKVDIEARGLAMLEQELEAVQLEGSATMAATIAALKAQLEDKFAKDLADHTARRTNCRLHPDVLEVYRGCTEAVRRVFHFYTRGTTSSFC